MPSKVFYKVIIYMASIVSILCHESNYKMLFNWCKIFYMICFNGFLVSKFSILGYVF